MAAQHMLEANTEFDWSVEFDPLFGPHQLCLSTERVAIVDSALDPDRRSFFDDPRLL